MSAAVPSPNGANGAAPPTSPSSASATSAASSPQCSPPAGLSVVGIDTNAEMIAALNAGRCPIPEPGLEALVAAGVAAGKLSGSTDPAAAGASRRS